ncbi:MAG: hypothetical protein ABIJ18_04295 [archaeon]
MKYLIEPKDRIWVAVNDRIVGTNSDEELVRNLQERTNSVQTWFFDLDDNHADSPAKKIAFGRVGTNIFDPKFLYWALTQGAPAKFIKSKESEAWRKYVNNFLRDEEALQEVRELFTEETARQSLYQGVLDFANLVSRSSRFYVTRNIAEVAEPYRSALGIDGFFPEADNKEKVVEGYLSQHPEVRIIGVDGDSEEDAAMIEVAQFYDREVVSFYSMNKPRDSQMDQRFDYSVSKNKSGLVSLLQE